MNPKRNDPCPCGSGLKYKKCCLAKGDDAPGDPDHVLKARADAFKAMSQQEWREAIDLFKSILDSVSDPAEIYQAIGGCYEGLEEYLMAAEFYEKAIKISGSSRLPDLYYQLGVARGCGQRIAKAIDAFNQSMELTQDSARKHHTQGILRMLGEIQEGKSDPNVFFVQVQLQRAFSEMEEEKYSEAAARLERLSSIDPENPAIFYNLGVVYTFLKEEEAALGSFQRSVDLFPQYYQAWYNMGQICLIKKQDFSRAMSCFDRVVAIRPDYVGGHHQRGMTLELLGDKPAALESWHKTLQIDPENKAAKEAVQRLS
jgi:tetratricopeptide (TPR) repeat protein